MKTFVLYNEALHHDSSYHEIIAICASRQEAEAKMTECERKVHEAITNGDFGDDFDGILPDSKRVITGDNWDRVIESTNGFYEAWRIEEHEMETPLTNKIFVLSETEGDYIHNEVFTSKEEAMETLRARYHDTAVNGDPEAIEKADYSEMKAFLVPCEGDTINWLITEHEMETPRRKWEIIHDEEIFDEAGNNFLGVISNGEDTLFFHAYKVNGEEDRIETCIVYNSLRGLIEYDKDSEECRYIWTSENDSKMLAALNDIPEGQSFCGEGGVLQFVEFNTDIDEAVGALENMRAKVLENRAKRLSPASKKNKK